MIPVIKNILRRIQRWARTRSLNAAVAEAKKINRLTGMKVGVYFVKGEYRALTKQQVKGMGYTGEQADAMAAVIVETFKGERMAKEKKLTAEEIKKLQEETKKKQNKIVKK